MSPISQSILTCICVYICNISNLLKERSSQETSQASDEGSVQDFDHVCNEARPIVLTTRRGLGGRCLPCWPIQKRTFRQKLFAGECRLFRWHFQICSQILSLMSNIRKFSKHKQKILELYAMPSYFLIILFILQSFAMFAEKILPVPMGWCQDVNVPDKLDSSNALLQAAKARTWRLTQLTCNTTASRMFADSP